MKELKALPIASYLANFSLFAKTRLKRETFVLQLKNPLCDNKGRKKRAQKSANRIRVVADVMEARARSLNLRLSCSFRKTTRQATSIVLTPHCVSQIPLTKG